MSQKQRRALFYILVALIPIVTIAGLWLSR
ncbi:hypothetical protein SAMN05192570_0401 [Brevundimonas viscosa]|uniref:Uncharacterized protein n=1 Tax=Brevundimonas viscosa TaxID=871741 RepID=A0A1I6NRJ9_9CAUL|nr:hypothetical protein SAMN05192570_0401 [Brevundimonas viscosa]